MFNEVDFKVVVDQPPIPGMQKRKDLVGIGYSFGKLHFNEERVNAIETVRVETKKCYLAYLAPEHLQFLMNKQKIRKEEKML